MVDIYDEHKAINEYGINNNRKTRAKRKDYDSELEYIEAMESLGIRLWK